MDTVIAIKDLTWGYPQGSSLIFKNFNFSLHKHEFCVLMGKSGCGKSTLAKWISGEFTPPFGHVYHKTEDIASYAPHQLQLWRRKLGMVFQDYKLIDELTVMENVIYPLRLYELGETIIEAKYAKVKQKLKLHSIEQQIVASLSAGEKQKVAIARALIHDPEVIVADEPTGNLDREHSQEIANLLIDANKMGNTILLITHDIHVVNYLKEHHPIRIEYMK